jgi:hypothetical protein
MQAFEKVQAGRAPGPEMCMCEGTDVLCLLCCCCCLLQGGY